MPSAPCPPPNSLLTKEKEKRKIDVASTSFFVSFYSSFSAQVLCVALLACAWGHGGAAGMGRSVSTASHNAI